MSDAPESRPEQDEPGNDRDEDALRRAKGAARETIGKLIGDDAAVREGRKQQKDAGGRPAGAGTEQE
jgi:uncharacterized protein YjbJ (UPF0337 family)